MAFHCGPFDALCVVFDLNRPLLTRVSSMSCFLTIPLYMALFWGSALSWTGWKIEEASYREAKVNRKEGDMTHGLGEVRRIAQEHGSDLALVLNHSGGKDSTRMLGFVRKNFPDTPTYAVMADTGFEHVFPISAADFARARCAEFGLDLTVVRNPKRTYLEMVEQRGMFPLFQYRQCTSDLKRGPIEKFIRSLLHKVIVNCIGIRSEESHPRSRLSPLVRNEPPQLGSERSTTGFRSSIEPSLMYSPGTG